MKTLSLYRSIRIEDHVHSVPTGRNGHRLLAATEAAQASRVGVVAVEDDDVVVGTLLVRLELEVVERQLDAVTLLGCEVPNAVLATRVEVGPVGAAQFTVGV